MNQRLAIALLLLVLALVALALAGMSSSPPADGATTVQPVLPGTMMSGDFAPTKYACAGVRSAPSVRPS